MIRKQISDIYNCYNINNNIVNRNSIKCILRALKKNELSHIEGQEYVFDDNMFIFLLDTYKKFLNYFDFFYSLKSDLVSFFDFLIQAKNNNTPLDFNAFFCPGYNQNGGYKEYLGNTTISKLMILNKINIMLKDLHIPATIHCYYCDTFIENCDYSINPNWNIELGVNRELFTKECLKYFDTEQVINISSITELKVTNPEGYVDETIVSNIPKNVYNSFKITNETFYKKLNFSQEIINKRNDILATMYIKVSNYINNKKSGIYLPMENMYDREKIIANNGTCTMYLSQEIKK